MAGIIRWRDLQNISTTEAQINLLAGLSVNAALLNQLSGFTGTGSQLNSLIADGTGLPDHIAEDLSTAHPMTANSIDGGVLADATISKAKLSFNVLVNSDKLALETSISDLEVAQDELSTQVENLYGIAFPEMSGDIAAQFAQLVIHIGKEEDAHDATAISYGNQYSLTANASSGATTAQVSLSNIKEFKVADSVEFRDTNSGPETKTLTSVNYDTGVIGWSGGLIASYLVANSAIVKNNNQANVQKTLERSLRNQTDELTGRLTITQSANSDALVINKTGSGYTASFNTFTGKTAGNFVFTLSGHADSSYLSIVDDLAVDAFKVTDQGGVTARDYTLKDRSTGFAGLLTKSSLSAARTWTLPNASGTFSLVGHTHVSTDITDFTTAARTAAVADAINNGVTNIAPSQNAVFDALALINTSLAQKLNLSGGTMSGSIDMGNNPITNLLDPSSLQDAATKNYVDTEIAAIGGSVDLSNYLKRDGTNTMAADLTFAVGGGLPQVTRVMLQDAFGSGPRIFTLSINGGAITFDSDEISDSFGTYDSNAIMNAFGDANVNGDYTLDRYTGYGTGALSIQGPASTPFTVESADYINFSFNPQEATGSVQFTVKNVVDPVDPQDAATKNYVDSLIPSQLPITLDASQTDTVIPDFTFAYAVIEGLEISYKLKEAVTNNVRLGTLRVVTNGTDVSIVDTSAETGVVSISFSAAINGGNVEVKYTSDVNSGTMKADVKSFSV